MELELLELQDISHFMLADGQWYEVENLREADPPFGKVEFSWLEWTAKDVVYSCPPSSIVAIRIRPC